MKKSILSTVAVVLAIITSGIAQEELVIVEQRNGRYQREKKPLRLNDNIGVIKFSPTQMLAGEIHFSYERQVSKNSSFEFAVGPTISNIVVGNNGGNHIFGPGGSGYSYQTSRLGMFAEVGYRYYPLEETEALNRFYLSPVLKLKMKNFGIEDGSGSLASQKGSDMRMNFSFNVGYQVWLSKTFSMDFFTGLGIGYRQYESYYPDNVYIDPTWTYGWADNSYTETRYVFNFGVKLGIGHK